MICSLIMGAGCIIAYLLVFAVTGSNAISTVLATLAGIIIYFLLAVNLKVIGKKDMENLPGGKYLNYLKL